MLPPTITMRAPDKRFRALLRQAPLLQPNRETVDNWISWPPLQGHFCQSAGRCRTGYWYNYPHVTSWTALFQGHLLIWGQPSVHTIFFGGSNLRWIVESSALPKVSRFLRWLCRHSISMRRYLWSSCQQGYCVLEGSLARRLVIPSLFIRGVPALSSPLLLLLLLYAIYGAVYLKAIKATWRMVL